MDDSNFVLEQTLGEGAFGKVYLVTSSEDNKKYALKVIDLRLSPQEEKDLAVKEANLLEKLSHPNILCYTDSFENNGAFCIVTEYCSNGDLSQYLAAQNKAKLDEDLLREWFRQISSALQYLHSKTIIHRDVKTPNIFLTDSLDTKLGDMGLAKVLERPSAKAVTFCGSPYYMSPEIFSAKPYGLKSDIWAMGVIVYEMATLERPFDAMLMHQLVSKIIHGGLPKMPEGYSPQLTDLLTKMMQKDPDKRPSADDILKHAYFRGDKPKLPPRPNTIPALENSLRWGLLITKSKRKEDQGIGGGPFKLNNLLGTLSQVQEKKKNRQKNLASSVKPETVVGIQTILNSPDKEPDKKKNRGKKDVAPKEWYETVKSKQQAEVSSDMSESTASASNVNITFKEKQEQEDFTKTLIGIQTKTATDAFDLMCTVVSMITDDMPVDKDKRQQTLKAQDTQITKIVIQIEHLQQYCIRVLKEDMGLFSQVQNLLSTIKDEDELERALINLIGKEKYDRCGIQLLFWRNFEHNLHKLQTQRKP